MQVGQLCEITQGEDDDGVTGYGISWRATDKMGSSPKVRPAKMTAALCAAFHIEEGSHVNLSKTQAKIMHAGKVILGDVTPAGSLDADYEDGKWKTRCAYALCEYGRQSLA